MPAHIKVPELDPVMVVDPVTGAGPYTFSFPYIDDDHIKVSIDGVVLDPGAYQVTPGTVLEGGVDGGTVTLTPALTAGRMRIYRQTTIERSNDFGNNGVRPVLVNNEFDRVHMIMQETRQVTDLFPPDAEDGALLVGKDGKFEGQVVEGQPGEVTLIGKDGDGNLRAFRPSVIDPNLIDPFDLITAYDTLALARAGAPIDAGVIFVGGRLYLRKASDPGHRLSFQTNAGSWFELAEDTVTSGDGLVHQIIGETDSTAVGAAWAAAYALDRHFRGDHNLVVRLPYDPVAGAQIITDDDIAAFDETVQTGKRSFEDPSVLLAERPGIAIAKGVNKALDYAMRCDVHRIGDYHLGVDRGLHPYWGVKRDEGFGLTSSMKGEGAETFQTQSVSFADDPTRPDGFFYAILTLDRTVPDHIVAGMCVNLGEFKPTTSNAVSVLSGVGYINLIYGTSRDVIRVPVYDARGINLTAPGNSPGPNFVKDGTAGKTSRPLGQVRIQRTQFAVRGGHRDRRDEAPMPAFYGPKVRREGFAWVDHIDPDVFLFGNRPPAVQTAPDTKHEFVGYGSLANMQSVDYCGTFSRNLRVAVLCDVLVNGCGFGGLAKHPDIHCKRGVGVQIASRVWILRSTFGYFLQYAVNAGSQCLLTVQSCVLGSSDFGVRAFEGAAVDIKQTRITYCKTAAAISDSDILTTGAQIDNCDFGLNLSGEFRHLGRAPTYTDVGTELIVRRSTGNSLVLTNGSLGTIKLSGNGGFLDLVNYTTIRRSGSIGVDVRSAGNNVSYDRSAAGDEVVHVGADGNTDLRLTSLPTANNGNITATVYEIGGEYFLQILNESGITQGINVGARGDIALQGLWTVKNFNTNQEEKQNEDAYPPEPEDDDLDSELVEPQF